MPKQFTAHLKTMGYIVPENLTFDLIRRLPDDKACVLYDFGDFKAGAFWSWRGGKISKFYGVENRTINHETQAKAKFDALSARLDKIRVRLDRRYKQKIEELDSGEILGTFKCPSGLVIPAYGEGYRIQGYEIDGKLRVGSGISACFFELVGKSTEIIYICDNWRQAVTGYRRGLHVVYCFYPDNLAPVYQAFKRKFPDKEIKILKDEITTRPLEGFTFGDGFLTDVINYYNECSGNYQYGFAIMTALALAATVLGRNYETNGQNRASLFLICVGLSCTGKQMGDTLIDKILMDAGLYNQLSLGIGFHSESAIYGTMCRKPSGIVKIDEFGMYLNKSQNKNSTGDMAQANKTMMLMWGKLGGFCKPMNSSLLGKTEKQIRQQQDIIVMCPAMTVLAMTTPVQFYPNIPDHALQDGFMNRFLVYHSNVEPDQHISKPRIKVPPSIINWINIVRERGCFNGTDTGKEEPETVVELAFTMEAQVTLKYFGEWCIKNMHELKGTKLDMMQGRLKEMSQRMALIIALSKDPYATIVTDIDCEQAIDWVKFNHLNFVDKLMGNVSESLHDTDKLAIANALIDAGKDGVTMRFMMRTSPYRKFKKKELEEILESLCVGDIIKKETIKNPKGLPSVTWVYNYENT